MQEKRIMNASDLRDAHINRWATSYGGGAGFETYQILMGGAAALIVTFIFWIFGMIWIGLGIALGAGYFVAIIPNHINTHHKDAKAYLRGKIKQRTNQSLVLNDRRVREPADERDVYVVPIMEFLPDEDVSTTNHNSSTRKR
jgi:hypothetical protein